jgi:hypothetical protein
MPRNLRLVAAVVALLGAACAERQFGGPAASAPPPAAPPPVSVGLAAQLPPGAQPLDESYRSLFEICDRTDRFGGIQLPIVVDGRTRWYGCRSDPSRLARLLRWPDGTVAWEAKLAVDLDGSYLACTSPPLTTQCPTWLMLRDPSTGANVPVDSDRIPCVVIPMRGPGRDPARPGVDVSREFQDRTGVRRADLGVVIRGDRVVPVLVADGGPFNKVGEGSIALHRALGRELCTQRDSEGRCVALARPLSGIGSGVLTVIFPGSAPAGLRPDTLAATVEREALARWRAFAAGP